MVAVRTARTWFCGGAGGFKLGDKFKRTIINLLLLSGVKIASKPDCNARSLIASFSDQLCCLDRVHKPRQLIVWQSRATQKWTKAVIAAYSEPNEITTLLFISI